MRHHPSQQVRADWVAANLPPGFALATAVHLEFCPNCAFRVQAMNGLLEAPQSPTGGEPPTPAPLQGVRLGEARRLARGVQAAPAQGVSGLGEAVWMVDLKPGARLKLPADSIGALVVVRGDLDSAVGELTAGDFLDLSVEPTDWVSAGLGGARLLAVSDGEWPPASVFAPLLRVGRRLRRR